jgi:hypothetical protein
MFHEILHKLELIHMALVSVDQDVLDALATGLEGVKTVLATEIADLAAQIGNNQPLPPASLDGLNAALADLTALEPPAPATP